MGGRCAADRPEAAKTDGLSSLREFGQILGRKGEGLENESSQIMLAGSLLRVRDRSGRIRALWANRVQRDYERRLGQRNIVLKARQMGISTWIAARFFLKSISQPGTLSVQVAHDGDSAEEIFRIVHRFYEHLPEAMRTGELRTSRANARQLVFPELDSEYRVESAADPNAGRGLTIQNLHCSEVARWPGDAAETLASLRAALAPGGEITLESTPKGAHGCFYEEWSTAESSGTVRHFFPWWFEREYTGTAVGEEELTGEERGLLGRLELTREQIGYRRYLRSNFRRLAAQEFAENPEECFLASGSCVFELGAIDGRLREVQEPLEQRRNGDLMLWYPPVKGRQYLASVDPAGGGEKGDFSTVQILEMKSGLQCAELQGKLAMLDLAEATAQLGREYNTAIVAVERNNHGAAVLAYLDTVQHYEQIYCQGGSVSGRPGESGTGQAGWLTSSLTRPRIVGRLGAMLVESPHIFSSGRLLRECRTFVRHRDGSTGAAQGTHDDCVMAMAIALAVREELLQRPGYNP